MPGVESVMPILKPYKLASREFKPDDAASSRSAMPSSAASSLPVIAGPCSVESEEQILRDRAARVKEAGRHDPARRRVQAAHLAVRLPGPGRGGPAILAEAREATGLPSSPRS